MFRTSLILATLAACFASPGGTWADARQDTCRVAASGARPAIGLRFWRRAGRMRSQEQADAKLHGTPEVPDLPPSGESAGTVRQNISAQSPARPARDSEVWPPAWALFPAEPPTGERAQSAAGR